MKRLLFILALLCAPLAYGQGGVPASPIYFSGPTGRPLAGATVTVCTSTGAGFPCSPLASIFTNVGLSIASPNPVTTDGNGNIPVIFAAPGVYVLSVTGSGITPTLVTATVAGSGGGNVVLGPNTGSISFTGTESDAGGTHTGPETFSGTTAIVNPCSIAGGLIFVAPAGCYTTLASAFAACPSAGCVIDMRGASTVLALGTFDPGATIPVTLLLGPYSYTAAQITLRNGFNLIGSGSGYTLLTQAVAGTPLFVINQVTPTQHVWVQGLNLQGAASSSTDAFHIFASSAGAGLWYSGFQDIVCGSVTTFGGSCFQFNGNTGVTGFLNQFITMRDIRAFRATSGLPALLITGLNGQFTIDGTSEFDAVTPRSNTDNGINVQIDDGTQTFRAPYTFIFNGATFQLAWGPTGVAIRTKGVQDLTIIDGHFENDNAIIKESAGTTFGSFGVSIMNSSIDTASGINGGNGFMANLDSQSSLLWSNNTVASTPDAMFTGTTTFLTHFATIKNNGATLQPQDSQIPNTFLAKRFGEANGTNLTSGQVGFSAGWGNTGNPAVTAITGTDAAFMLNVTAGGAALGANPAITITFADGTWTNPPVCVPSRTDASAPASGYWAYNAPGSATNAIFTFVGTPVASTGYGMSVTCFKKQN